MGFVSSSFLSVDLSFSVDLSLLLISSRDEKGPAMFVCTVCTVLTNACISGHLTEARSIISWEIGTKQTNKNHLTVKGNGSC